MKIEKAKLAVREKACISGGRLHRRDHREAHPDQPLPAANIHVTQFIIKSVIGKNGVNEREIKR